MPSGASRGAPLTTSVRSRCSSEWQGQDCGLPTLGVLAGKIDQRLSVLLRDVEVLWSASQAAWDR